mgnify:CR=1 FL=1
MRRPHTWTRDQHDDEQLSLQLTQLNRPDGFQAVTHDPRDDMPFCTRGDIPAAILHRFRINIPHRRP